MSGKGKKRALLGGFEAEPLSEFEGILYPSFFPFRQKGVEAHLKDIRNFDTKESDIIMCNYPKSGTHWMREILSVLISQDDKLEDRLLTPSIFEYETDLSILADVASPRVYSTHLTSNYIPKHHLTNGGKIIHLLRNPKDVCVSAYNHYRRDLIVDLDITWEEFIDLWIDGKLIFANWYDHARDYDNRPVQEITRLADFLNIPCSPQLVDKISTVTKFDYMKNIKKDNSNERTVDGKGFIYRKGEIGDWKTWFTVSQNDRFNQQYCNEVKDIEFKHVFDQYMC